ncbi:MAG: response regulator [Candidatus Marinimicrobia bacterium]|nr:response regulator [Candidatus Neomarinimicrobiota bacterium]
MKYFLTITLISFVLFQTVQADLTKSNMDFYQIDTDLGLSHNRATVVEKGPNGFMWFGTYSGLNRYDGYNIKIYKHKLNDSKSIINNWITDIKVGPDSNLWIGTISGLQRYLPKKDGFKRYLEGNYINNINIIGDSLLFVAAGYGLWRYKKHYDDFALSVNDPHDKSSINNNSVYDIISLQDGRILVATYAKNIQQYNIQNNSFSIAINHTKLPPNCAKYLLQDSEGYIWIGTDSKGLYRYNPVNKELINYTGKSKERNWIAGDPFELPNKKVLFPAQVGGGLNIFDLTTKKFNVLKPDPKDGSSLSNPDVYDIYFDNRNNTLWVSTLGGGINVYDPERIKFELIKHNPYLPKSLSPKPVISIYKDSKGELWIGTDHGGLNLYQEETNGFKHFRKNNKDSGSLSSNVILDIEEYPEGNLLLGTWGGAINSINLDNKNVKRFTPNPDDMHAIPTSNVFDIFIDSQKRIWFTIWEEGVGIYNHKKGSFKKFKGNSQLPPFIQTINEDQFGNIWFAGQNMGIWIYEKESKKIYNAGAYSNDSLLLSINQGKQLYFSKNKFMWLPTDNGLYKIDPNTKRSVKHYTVRDGLPTNSLVSIIEDNNGDFWIGSAKGIIKFDHHKEDFIKYEISDGLQGSQFENGAVFKDSKGYLYFGGNKGYNKFHPNKIPLNKIPPKIVFTDFKIFNQSVKYGAPHSPLQYHINETKNIELSCKQNLFTFEFAALNYTNPHQNHYAYKLEGFDSNWKYVGHKRTATYTNIDPGKYKFRVKAANNDGIWNQKGRLITITIVPPYWRKNWFKILVISVLTLLIGGYIRYRTKVIKKRNQSLQVKIDERTEKLKVAKKEAEEANRAKSEFVANVSHEIRTPMNCILGFSELLIAEENNPKKLEDLYAIKQSGMSLLDLINDILDLSKIESNKLEINNNSFNIIKVLETIENMFKNKAEEKNLLYKVYICDSLPTYLIGDKKRIRQIMVNIVGNAIKYTKEGQVNVHCFYQKRLVVFSVEDTGIGISEDKIEELFQPFHQIKSEETEDIIGSGLGLTITMKLIKLMGGTIDVESGLGEGSVFTVKLPLKIDGQKQTMPNSSEREKKKNKLEVGIVDDSQEYIKIMKKIIEQNRGKLYELPNNKSIVDEIERLNIEDIIVIDYHMPGCNGYQLNKILKKSTKTAQIPTILCTATDEANNAIYHGFDYYVEKPVTKKKIWSVLDKTIKKSHASRTLTVVRSKNPLNDFVEKMFNNNYRIFYYKDINGLLKDLEEGLQTDLSLIELGNNEQKIILKIEKCDYFQEIPIIFLPNNILNKELIARMQNFSIGIFKIYPSIDDELQTFINNYFGRNASEIAELAEKWVQDFIASTDDDPDFKAMIFEYLAEIIEQINEVEAALNLGDPDAIEDSSHKLKGNAGNYQLREFAQHSADICNIMRKEEGKEIPFERLMKLFIQLKSIYYGLPDNYLHKTSINEEQHQNDRSQILVADDAKMNCKLMRRCLNKFGLQCNFVSNGKEVLQALNNKNYKLLFLDIKMPIMDGMEVLAHIRNNDNYKDLKIIALTANVMKGDREKYKRAGCDDYLPKPLDTDDLQEKLKQYGFLS